MAKTKKTLTVPSISGAQARAVREKSGKNQHAFWAPLGITQSGGSRYESGRNIPEPVRILLALKTGTKAQKLAALEFAGIDLSCVAAEILAAKGEQKAA